MAVNGEIYNHKELIASVQQSGLKSGVGFEPRTGSDCEALLALYERDGLDFLSKNEVCGMYACCIYDKRTDSFVLARDHVGMIPLYYGRGSTTEVAKVLQTSMRKIILHESSRFLCTYSAEFFYVVSGRL